ncbi:MAG: zinc ribbon domain-containing protein [Clostridia bacterium]|nr:zinc ribbon domain-containing protein [Clostridia bacterium]
MGTQASASRIYNLNINVLACELRSRHFSDLLRVSLKSENPMPGGCWFRFHHGMTLRSYGERITVTLIATSQTSTVVEVYSEAAMPTQFIDFGINNSNINAIYQHLDQYLVYPSMAKTAPQPMPQEAPQPKSAPQQTFCTGCGAPMPSDFRFCNRCGKPR